MSGEDPRTVREIGEEGLIAIFDVEGGALGGKVLVPNGDDAAAWFLEPKYANVITTDSQVEGVHFDLRYTPPVAVGRKLMSVNLSDVAAMGARPRYVLLAVSVPPHLPVSVVQKVATGIKEICKLHGVAVLGGNTTTIDGPLVLTATVIGRAEPSQLIRRRGTMVGDGIYVTGRLGDAKAGLRLVQSGVVPALGTPYYSLYKALVDPQARVEAGRRLANVHLVHAMCDISDGFGKDLRHLLVPEGLGARIEAQALPISQALRSYGEEAGFSPELEAMMGGEDYELLFTAPMEEEALIVDACASVATPVSRVGTVLAAPELEVFMPDGSVVDLPTASFEHYAGGDR
ncbi:MAG: thiamine-phosphate kinase [Deltaproteobacteria bacterium]|nr:thiamine-phosphate kinase [Deltaproteobacteria bacterium]